MQKSQADYMEEVKQIKEKQEQIYNHNQRNTSAREAYTCWAHQQANPNLSEIPITQILDIMQTIAEKGRPMFYCASNPIMEQPLPQKLILKSLLRTAPPSPSFHSPHPPPN
ncbi:hypothetical protein PIB30_086902 [Stylosanthes scabra]|uniref:Uncharacterized protein n=1 Tax=Stylosanthes scabra TaxID=79078 RepID=A0ABU6STT4_9FABA|nr:hypothetical protein [Stylosanthes scabra]